LCAKCAERKNILSAALEKLRYCEKRALELWEEYRAIPLTEDCEHVLTLGEEVAKDARAARRDIKEIIGEEVPE